MKYRTVPDSVLESGHHLASDEKITEGQVLPNTVAPEGDDSLAGTEFDQDQRWGVTPLYTKYHEYALTGEYLCDPNTGEPAIKREDGSVVNVSEIARFHYHVELFSTAMSYLGMRARKIWSLFQTDDTCVPIYDGNLIDGDCVLKREDDSIIENIAISFDLSILEKIPDSSMLRMIDHDPIIVVEYLPAGYQTTQSMQMKASDWRFTLIPVQETSITLKGIKIPDLDADSSSKYVCFTHSILVGF